MDTSWLSSWLTELNLSEYIVTFKSAGYATPEQCATIRGKEELRSMGVVKVGHLNRLFRAVEKLAHDLNTDGIETIPESSCHPSEMNNSDTQMERGEGFEQSKSVSLSSLGREAAGETKPPPPVPKRKSVRRSTTAPINRAESQSTDAHLSLAPPPVLPRQQSLKVQSTADVKKPPVAARRGTRTMARGEEMKQEVPPLSTPMAPSSSSTLPAGVSACPTGLSPQPKPRPKPRLHSPDPALMNRKLTDTSVPPEREGQTVANGPTTIPPALSDVPNVVENSSSAVQPEVKSPSPPPLPVKKATSAKKIIIPEEDVVFELEDVPMPETPQATTSEEAVSKDQFINLPPVSDEPPPVIPSTRSPIPALPPKESDSPPPSVSIAPFEETQKTVVQSPVPALPPKEDEDMAPSLPPLPPKDNPDMGTLLSETSVHPPPIRRHFVTGNEDADLLDLTKTPPLPRRDTDPPKFSPPLPEPEEEAGMPPAPPPAEVIRTTSEEGDPTSIPELPMVSADESLVSPEQEVLSEFPESVVQSNWYKEEEDTIPVSGVTSLPQPGSGSGSEKEVPPVLPPKEQHPQPPPPPPITPEDYPEDFSDSDMTDSEEECGPMMSIQSSRTHDNDQLMVTHVPSANGEMEYSDDEISVTTPSSSAESTPKKKTLIRQSGPSLQRGFTDEDIMVVSPSPLMTAAMDDYMNQEAIDKAKMADIDYMNQEAIDQTLADEDDVAATNVDRQHFTIRGSSPIKSRTLELSRRQTDRDYENQNMVDKVLEDDIIPVSTLPGAAEPISLVEETRRDYSYSTPPAVTSMQHHVKKHRYEELDIDFSGRESAPPRSTSVSVGGWQRTADHPPAVAVSSYTKSTARQEEEEEEEEEGELVHSRSTKDNLEVEESPLESSGGSLNQTFPRTVSTSSSHHKPPLPKQQSQQKTEMLVKQRSLSVENSVDIDGALVASVPVTSGVYHQSSQLPRAAGTFAGIDSGYKKPTYNRFQSDDPFRRNLDSGRDFSESTMFYPGATRKDSADLKNVPKTKEGFLYKKGGVHGDKPWQRRWVTFNGTELKYFKNQSDKDKSSRNIVTLAEMIDVKKVPDDDKPNRFDLVVINRVFQFHSDSLEDTQLWISVLHAAISRFKPQEAKEGGNMSDPDRQGFLLKQGHGPFAKFKERYVALKGSKFAYYLTKDDYVHGRPIHILEMTLSSVRPDMVAKLPRFVITMNNQKQYVFQAADELERKEWMDVLTSAILTGLDTREQTLARVVKQTKSTEILQQIQENPSNKTCADCAATDPVWGVINLGIMVCINCSGVHRSMGTHISKVRSVELDHQIWKPTLIQLMNMIGNEKSNSFWERHMQRRERLPPDVERDIREGFIRAKYQDKSWIPTPTGESQDMLNKLLCVAVTTDNLMRTVELLVRGADVCHVVNDPNDPDISCALDIAKKHDQTLQVELLEQNGALICRKPQEAAALPISKKGFLYKTGSDRAGWKKRYCSLDKFRGFQYYKSETDSELLGDIHMEEMMSVSRCEDEITKDPKYQHCFEVNTQGRGYLFCADSESEMVSWIQVFEQIINTSDAAENLGYDKVGYLKKKDPHNVGGWKRRWFTLKGKSLAYYKREREEVDEIDLRKVTDLKGPDPAGSYEQQCCIQIIVPDRTYYLRAETPVEAESWMSALRHTQVSGIPLSEQQLTSTGIPILIHKCLQFVESYGMETEGLYRLSGEKAKIRKLILAFNQDARGVVIDPEMFTVHDVTGTLKQFFRSLPDPLLTHQLYNSFISTMQSDHESQLYQLQSLIEQLPQVNKDTLKRMIGHLRKVAEYEAKNKMGVSNLVSLFGPTIMTVDGDPISFANTQYECNCVNTMIKYYKWLFQVDQEEEKKEEAIEKGLQKIKEAEQMQQRMASISSNLGFLTTIYIGSKEGDSFNTNITGQTTVGEVVEDVATRKALPKNNYALYLVLGDSESHRVLSFSEKLLAAQCSAGTDCFLCLKPNTFADTLSQYFNTLGEGMPVTIHVREKKKWRKYPCTVRNSHFIQFKDTKCHNEFFKVSVNDLDIFAGIERNKIDVKNPMPTRYCFWLKTMRGEENCKYLCADSEADMLKLIAAVVQAKYPDHLQTPSLPVRPPPENLSPPLGNDHRPHLSAEDRRDSSTYANVKLSGRNR